MVIYDNKFETKKIKFPPRIKLNHNIFVDDREFLDKDTLLITK